MVISLAIFNRNTHMICPSFIPFIPSQIVDFSVPYVFWVAKSPVIRSEKPGKKTVLLTYHLVMTNSLPWKDPPFLIGKPSISIRAIYTMAMLNNQRVNLIVG